MQAILNSIFLQHGIYLNTSEPVKLQGILHVHSRYTGMNLTLTGSLPFRMFLGFSRAFVCLLLFSVVDIVPCLFNLLHYIINW